MNALALLLLAANQTPLPSPGFPCALANGVQLVAGAANRVALSGDTAVVATQASARVYVRDGGIWTEQGVLSHSAHTPRGTSLWGDTIFIGVPTNDEFANNAGKVFVFERTGTTWTLQQELFASDATVGDLFGYSTAVQGDTAFVGAISHGSAGAVYRFERVNGTWCEMPELLTPVDGSESLGVSAALSGDTLVVGGRLSGVHVFVQDGGDWVLQAVLLAPSDFIEGTVVSISGDTILAGALGGGGQVYVREGTDWVTEGLLSGDHDLLGESVALSGDVAVVGARGAPLGDFMDSEAIVYVRGNSTWTPFAKCVGSFAALTSVAVQRGTVLIGLSGALTQQSADVFELPPFTAASVDHRNAGTNPDSYTSTPAYIGQTLHFSVDLATTGHDQALVFGFDSPFELLLGGGQTLLCLDLLGSGGELINTGFHPGPIAEIDFEVPNNIALSGFAVWTQAVHAFGVMPFALSNAQDIVIGACL